jgi:hypothetical protein
LRPTDPCLFLAEEKRVVVRLQNVSWPKADSQEPHQP